MKKFLALIIFICIYMFPMDVFADEKLFTCSYNFDLKSSDVDLFLRFKFSLYQDNNGNYYLEKYRYADNEFKLMSGSNDYFDYVKADGSRYSGPIIYYTSGVTAEEVKKYYDANGNCPYIALQNYDTTQTLFITEDTSLNSQHEFSVAAGNISEVNNNSGVVEPPVESQITKKCTYTLNENSMADVDSFEFEFYMKNDGKKYWTAKIGGYDESYRSTAEISWQNSTIILSTDTQRKYTIVLPSDELENIFIQTPANKLKNTFECVDASKIGLVEDLYVQAVYHISTDSEELSDDNHSGTFGEEDFYSDTDYNSICSDINVKSAARFIGILLFIVKILVPLLIIILGMIDFIKAITSNDDKGISKSTISLIKRIVAGLVIFFIPTIVMAILNVIEVSKGIEKDSNTQFGMCTKCIFDPFGSCQIRSGGGGYNSSGGGRPNVNRDPVQNNSQSGSAGGGNENSTVLIK